MLNKCRPKYTVYEYKCWTGYNIDEISNFCNDRIGWRDKFEGSLILYDNRGLPFAQIINQNDYIIKFNEHEFKVLDSKTFNKDYEII